MLVAGLLIAGITAATTFADNGQGKAGGKLLDRVAQLLNIDQQKLTDAFKQAGNELRQDRMNSMFDKWVSDGKLTQDQANQYKTWLAAKPAGTFGPFMGQTAMDKLLKDGKITQVSMMHGKHGGARNRALSFLNRKSLPGLLPARLAITLPTLNNPTEAIN
ncbi:MAG: hypothetical protein ABSA18_01810 [Dehalococcoidia bacterium]